MHSLRSGLTGWVGLGSVLIGVSAWGQIEYLTRLSSVGYAEQDFNLLNSNVTSSSSDSDGTNGFGTFNSIVGLSNPLNDFNETAAAQFSQLFADAIVFETRVLAEEDRTSNAFGVYDAVAGSVFEVDFRVTEEIPFTLAGETFSASSGGLPGTTTFSLAGPGVTINQSSGPLGATGVFQANGTYRLEAFAESVGQYNDGFGGLSRTRGEDLGFDFVLLLGDPGPELPGDYDGGGSVEQSDLDLVLTGWGGERGSWENAEGFATTLVDQEELDLVLTNWGTAAAINHAGTTEQVDLDLVLTNWGSGVNPPVINPFENGPTVSQEELDAVLTQWGSTVTPSPDGAIVPEPITGLMLLALPILMKRTKPTV